MKMTNTTKIIRTYANCHGFELLKKDMSILSLMGKLEKIRSDLTEYSTNSFIGQKSGEL